MSDRPNLADRIPEPPDGTLLILQDGERVHRVVLRADAEARQTSDFEDERWFDATDMETDPLAWREALKYATKVYACGQVLASL
jgi:hypothetical protein